MKPKKVLFLEASGGGGHISITTAIIQALNRKYPGIITLRADLIPPIAHKFYQFSSRQFVNAHMFLYKATNNQRGEMFASKINHVISRKKLVSVLDETKADLVFSNYSFAIDNVPEILQEINKPVPFIVFVPDPFTAHSFYFSKTADRTLVSTLTTFQAALNKGININNLQITGHPVREEFRKRPSDIRSLRKELGLDPDTFTIMFGGSGHGAEKTLEILVQLGAKPSTDLIKELLKKANLNYRTYYKLFLKAFQYEYKKLPKFQAICVCGDNIELKKTLEMLDFPSYIKPFIYLNPNNLSSLVHASDVVAGKAGPNILFESIMAGKPFLATYHIKGQEDGNINFIRSTQIGFVEENPQDMARIIETILHKRELLEYTKNGIENIYNEHKDAPDTIAETIKNLL